MPEKIRIANKIVGNGAPVFVIVEIGSNYNQDFSTAKKMIDIVKAAGADAVKFQIFKAKKVYVKDAGKVDYLKKDIPINDLVKKAEVPDQMHRRLFDYCRKINLLYLCSVGDEEVADYLEKLGVSAYKITSYDLTNHFLLRHVARKKKPIFLSTGGSNFKEIAEALKVIKATGNNQIVLLQCVAQYPAEYRHTNLRTMENYEKKFGVSAGISDHSFDPFIVPYAATALGAKAIEKHFTLDREQEGPDHSFAVEPDELKKMIFGIRQVESAMGEGEKRVTAGDKELRRFAFRSIFSTRLVKKGDKLTTLICYVLRTGKKEPGIEAKYYEDILGLVVAKDIGADQPIKWNNVLKR